MKNVDFTVKPPEEAEEVAVEEDEEEAPVEVEAEEKQPKAKAKTASKSATAKSASAKAPAKKAAAKKEVGRKTKEGSEEKIIRTIIEDQFFNWRNANDCTA